MTLFQRNTPENWHNSEKVQDGRWERMDDISKTNLISGNNLMSRAPDNRKAPDVCDILYLHVKSCTATLGEHLFSAVLKSIASVCITIR